MSNVKLSLFPVEREFWEAHEESGASFNLQPISPRKDQDFRKKATDSNGRFDSIVYHALAMQFAIVDWKGVGDRLSITPAREDFWAEHKDSGARLKLRPVLPSKHQALQRQSRGKTGGVDTVLFMGNFAKHAILDWEGIGRGDAVVECSPENRQIFGENRAYDPMPWVVDQVMSIENHIVTEGGTPAQCTDETKRAFGEAFSHNLASRLVDRALGLAGQVQQEVEDAKKD